MYSIYSQVFLEFHMNSRISFLVISDLFDVRGYVVQERRRLRCGRVEERVVGAALGVELGVLLLRENLRRESKLTSIRLLWIQHDLGVDRIGV